MSQAVNQAMPSTDIEAAHIRHMLAEAVDSVQAPDAENGTVAAHYQIAGRFDDGALQAHVKDMIAALSPMPARLARSAQAVFIELFENICRYGLADGQDNTPFGHISILPVKISKATIFCR